MRTLSAGMLAACAGGFGPHAVAAPDAHALSKADVQALAPGIEAAIQHAIDTWDVPGLAVGIVADDQLVYGKGFGVRRQGGDEPVDLDTLFQIGSSTKAFLGVTLAQLVDDGKLRWDDKVAGLYPGFRLMDAWVTGEFEVADLLAQRSGLPASVLTGMMTYDYPEEDIIAALRYITPVTSFRSTFAYQNAFHLIAGKIVARAGGAPDWETFLTDSVLRPLGMNHSHGTAQALLAVDNRATGHGCNFGQAPCAKPVFPFPYNAHGAGGLNSSVRDLAQWLRLHINGGEVDGKRIVSEQALETTYLQRVPMPPAVMKALGMHPADRGGYATGWFIHSVPEGRVIEHCGATIGFMGCVAFDPDRKAGIVLLTNRLMDLDLGLAPSLMHQVMAMLQGRRDADFVDARRAVYADALSAYEQSLQTPGDPAPPRALSAYVGAYENPALGKVTITDQDGRLVFKVGPRQLPVALDPWSGDVFMSHTELPVVQGDPVTETRPLRFTVNEQNRIDGFDWSGHGDHFGLPAFTRTSQAAH
ncbi:serine hydrolase [Castellaniella hirudinis]|uniref:Serine hydrolase n=1 Tax=Castellaniella hirudinis TaxID=1144617 RepID=A0ABV8RXW1_9BURK